MPYWPREPVHPLPAPSSRADPRQLARRRVERLLHGAESEYAGWPSLTPNAALPPSHGKCIALEQADRPGAHLRRRSVLAFVVRQRLFAGTDERHWQRSSAHKARASNRQLVGHLYRRKEHSCAVQVTRSKGDLRRLISVVSPDIRTARAA